MGLLCCELFKWVKLCRFIIETSFDSLFRFTSRSPCFILSILETHLSPHVYVWFVFAQGLKAKQVITMMRMRLD